MYLIVAKHNYPPNFSFFGLFTLLLFFILTFKCINFVHVQMTPIGFANGTLSSDLSTWIGNDNTPANTGNGRTKLNISDPDVPTEYLGATEVDSETNQFITFDTTSARKDVSQLK